MLKSTHRGSALAGTSTLPAGWTEHKAPSGHSYYYNSETKQSTYTRPVEAAEAPLSIDYNAASPDHVSVAADQSHLYPARTHLDHGQGGSRGQGIFRGGRSYQERSRRRDEDRPKSKAVIPNCAPWILVKTKYSRRFVHNAETNESFWKFPQDVMLAVIEMERLEWEAGKKVDKTDDRPPQSNGKVEKSAVPLSSTQPRPSQEDDSDSYEEVEVTDDEAEDGDPLSKRVRVDDAPPGPVEFDEEDIAYQLAQMGEEYGLDPGEYDNPDGHMDEGEEGLQLTDQDAADLFKNLLDDIKVNPYSTFDRLIEDGQAVDDNRYTVLPNMARRREVFSDWSRERIEQLQEQRAKAQSVKKEPKIDYLCFLSEYASTKLYWPEFKRKYRKENIMKDVGMSDKEKEKLYRDFVAKLKLSEGDRKKELVKLLREVPPKELNRKTTLDALPSVLEKDIRFWVVQCRLREELVEAHIATIEDA